MSLALVLLRNGTSLVSQIDQLEYEPKVHMTSPYIVTGSTKVTLTSWPNYTDDTHILLHSDSILTVCEPNEKLAEAYLAKVGKTLEDLTPEPQPVTLNEEFQFEESEDEYEPRYLEE